MTEVKARGAAKGQFSAVLESVPMHLFILSLAVAVAGTVAYAGEDIGDPQAGYEYARDVCSGCHGISAEASPIAKATRFREVADRPGMTGTALREKPAEIAALVRAYNRAVAAVNADPDRFRATVVEKAALPPPTTATMQIPEYAPAAPPTAEQVADVAAWMLEMKLITALPPAGAICTTIDPDR